MKQQTRRAAQAHGQDRVPLEPAQGYERRKETARADPVPRLRGGGGLAKEHHAQDGQPGSQDQLPPPRGAGKLVRSAKGTSLYTYCRHTSAGTRAQGPGRCSPAWR